MNSEKQKECGCCERNTRERNITKPTKEQCNKHHPLYLILSRNDLCIGKVISNKTHIPITSATVVCKPKIHAISKGGYKKNKHTQYKCKHEIL